MASSTRLLPFGNGHDVAAGEGRDLAGLHARKQCDAEVHVRVLLLGDA